MGEALFKYIEPKGFEKSLHGAGKPVRDSMLGSGESVVTRQLKLRETGLHPGTSLETIARSTVSLEAQNAMIDKRLAWMEARTDGKHSKGTNTIPFSVHNIDELPADLGLQLGPLTRFKQWLMPIEPGDYGVATSRLLERHRHA